MLSRTADHLYWMARYTERAENTARMLDVAVQTSMLPQSAQDAQAAWRAMLSISELEAAFDKRYEVLDSKTVLAFMVSDPENPSSIASCLTGAARAGEGRRAAFAPATIRRDRVPPAGRSEGDRAVVRVAVT